MKLLVRVQKWVSTASFLLTGTAAVAGGDTLVIKMSKGATHTYSVASSPNPVPPDMLAQAKAAGRRKPAAAVKPGDTLVFLNDGTLVYKPFSLSPGNRFAFGKAGIKPGESKSYVVKNDSAKPIFLAILDDIHNNTGIMLVVLGKPGGAEATEGAFSGDWNSTVGMLTMTQAGTHVKGRFTGPPAGTLEGDVDSNGVLRFKWTQGSTHGIGKFEVDGDSFKGTWNYILSDGKSIGRGGQWKGNRIKA